MGRTTPVSLVSWAALVLGLSACGLVRQAPPVPAQVSSAAHPEPTAGRESSDDGIVAEAASSAYPVEGHDLRLVRTGANELALQFEFFNGTGEPLSPDELLDRRQQLVALVDLPRGTAYGLLGSGVVNGRLSANAEEEIEPGRSATLTAVFAAPPEETTEMLVALDGMLPVSVPVLPEGSPVLSDDPVLHGGPRERPRVGAVVCEVSGARTASAEFRLPSDVLFDFGSGTLSPAAASALGQVGERIATTSGRITIEGHTDAVGADASNDRLSKQRAAAVLDALRAKVGDGFTYQANGRGESRPVAPNAKPDGDDDPDGRARNRRVEVKVETTATARPLRPATGGTELTDAGLRVGVREVRRVAGYVLAQVAVANPTSEAVAFDYQNHFTPKEITLGQISLADRGERRHRLCGFAEPTYFDFLGTLSETFAPNSLSKVPAGAEVVMWGLFAAPRSSAVEVEIAGFAGPGTAEITG